MSCNSSSKEVGHQRTNSFIQADERGLRELVNTANCPIFGTDLNGRINEWNYKTAEIVGYSRQEAYNKNLINTFIVSQERESVRAMLAHALEGKDDGVNKKVEVITRGGNRSLLMNASPRRNAEKEVIGILIVAQDVTNQAREERDVVARAEELRKLVDQANAPIFGVNLEGNVNEWNNKTAFVTGYTREEVQGRPLLSFILPKLKQSVKDVLDLALAGAATSNYEMEFETKLGERRFFMVNISSRRDHENEIVGVIGVAQDVTETSRMERAIKATANELRQLVETANAPIFGIDVDGNVNEWNDKTAEITGYTKDEAFRKPLVSTYIVPYLQHSVQEVLDNALKGIETSNYELEFRTKNGETRYLLVNATTRRDDSDRIVGVVGVAQDVTESRKHDREVC